MNTRQCKKALRRMYDSGWDKRLLDIYINKKWSKCILRYQKKICREKNEKEIEKGSSLRYAPYIMATVTPLVGNYLPSQELSTRYANTNINSNFYKEIKIENEEDISYPQTVRDI